MGSSDDGGEPPRSGFPPSHRDVDVVAINLQRPSPAASALGGNHNRAASGEGALKIQAHQRLQLDGQDLPVPTCFLRQALVGEEARCITTTIAPWTLSSRREARQKWKADQAGLDHR